VDTSRVILDITQYPRSVWTGLPPHQGCVKTEEKTGKKSCRKGPKIKHVQHKCTMCFKTFTLFFLYLQNRAFPKRVVSIFDLRVMSSNTRGCQFRLRMKVNLKWK